MSILIGPIEFQGPYTDPAHIKSEPGLYALFCQTEDNYEFLHLDDSHCLKDCLHNDGHTNNLTFLQDTCQGQICAAVAYMPLLRESERTALKYKLLAEIDTIDMEVTENGIPA